VLNGLFNGHNPMGFIYGTCYTHGGRKIMKRADLGQKKVAPKKMEEVKEAFDDEISGASVNEVSSLLSTQKIEQAIIKRAVQEQVQDTNAQEED